MATNARKKRRINRFVLILSKIYEIDYRITKRIYEQFQNDDDKFKDNLAVAKIKLKAMNQNQNELAIIDSVNLYF